jgi:hypothetical protein
MRAMRRLLIAVVAEAIFFAFWLLSLPWVCFGAMASPWSGIERGNYAPILALVVIGSVGAGYLAAVLATRQKRDRLRVCCGLLGGFVLGGLIGYAAARTISGNPGVSFLGAIVGALVGGLIGVYALVDISWLGL